MKTRAATVLTLALAALALAACAAPAARQPEPTPPPAQIPTAQPPLGGPAAEDSVETIYLAPELKDCTGVAPMRCMQIAASPEGPWTLFYSQIEGFTFEEGFAYELKIRKEPVANPPADGSSIRYILVEQVSKTPATADPATADELAGTSWALSDLNGAAPVAEGQPATLAFDDKGGVAGSTGCNRFFGGYSVDGAKVTFGQLGSTRMACPEPLMKQEQAFFDLLGRAATYAIAADTLTITAADGATITFTRA